MRRIVDALGVLVILAIGLLVVIVEQGRRSDDQVIADASQALRRFEREVRVRAATDDVVVNGRGWPVTIDPGWFSGAPPENPLLTRDRPWVEVAAPNQAHQLHPDSPVAFDSSVASFWYNPYNGVIRARVPHSLSDKQALELYNRVNGTALASIFAPSQRLTPPTAIAGDEKASEAEKDPMDPTKPATADASGAAR